MTQFKTRLLSLALATMAFCAVAGSAFASDGAEGGFDFGDLGQAIASLIIFGILLWILGKYAWKPIVKQLENREKGIAEKLDHAQKRQEESERLLAQYQARLNEAQAQAQALMNEARKEASSARETILQAAQADAQKTATSLRQEIEQAKQEAMRDLYDRTAGLATEIAGKILRRTLKPEDHRQILDESLSEIRQQASRNQ